MSRAFRARISGESGNRVLRRGFVRALKTRAPISPAMMKTKHATAKRTDSAPVSSDAATISGEGVSPAASASASGSPPGSARDTSSADEGRRAGFGSRQRWMTFLDGGIQILRRDGERSILRSMTGEHFGENHSQRVDVAAYGDFASI